MRRTKTLLIALGVLTFVDGLLLVTGTFTAPAKAVLGPSFGLLGMALYEANPERFHRRLSRKVAFWSIFGTVAAFAALVVLGLIIR
jgi:hypothetical protein